MKLKKDLASSQTVALVGDLHIGSTVALCPPVVNLDDGGTYHASPVQKALWDAWVDFCDKVPNNSVIILGGDLVEIDSKNRSWQMMTRNHKTLIDMTLDTLEPLVDKAASVYVIRGTEAHTGKSCWAEEQLAADLDNSVKVSEDVSSWWLLRKSFGGVRMDVEHHMNMGGKPWTEKNSANSLAADIIFRYAEMGELPPHLAFRFHQHRLSDSSEFNYPVRVITMPCWTLGTAHVNRIGAGGHLPHIGGAIVRCENGKYDLQVERYNFKRVPIWE